MTHRKDMTVEFAERVARIEAAVAEIRDAIKIISTAIVDIAQLEQKHGETSRALARAFTEINNHEERMKTLETSMPVLKLTSKWVLVGTISVVGIVGAAIIKTIFKGG